MKVIIAVGKSGSEWDFISPSNFTLGIFTHNIPTGTEFGEEFPIHTQIVHII